MSENISELIDDQALYDCMNKLGKDLYELFGSLACLGDHSEAENIAKLVPIETSFKLAVDGNVHMNYQPESIRDILRHWCGQAEVILDKKREIGIKNG